MVHGSSRSGVQSGVLGGQQILRLSLDLSLQVSIKDRISAQVKRTSSGCSGSAEVDEAIGETVATCAYKFIVVAAVFALKSGKSLFLTSLLHVFACIAHATFDRLCLLHF